MKFRGRLLAGAWTALMMCAACGGDGGVERGQPVMTVTESGTSTAPPAREVEARGNALVRFVHAAPGVAATDVFAQDTKLFTNIAYKSVTPYHEVAGGKIPFRLRLAGQDSAQPVAEDSESLTDGAHYTLIVVPTGATAIFSQDGGQNAEFRFVNDELAAPTAGKAKLRVINTSPDLSAVDVYAAGRADALLKDVQSVGKTTYAEMEPLQGALEVRRAGENINTLNLPDVRIEAGKIYTVIVAGRVKGTSKLESILIEDRIGSAAATGTASPSVSP
ncbi:MAG: DUF4397 domain-containing protein [Acidobacteriota bacterium]|nr:DUF4397 domain-containing protein [Acidobacteriota bacterium]